MIKSPQKLQGQKIQEVEEDEFSYFMSNASPDKKNNKALDKDNSSNNIREFEDLLDDSLDMGSVKPMQNDKNKLKEIIA